MTLRVVLAAMILSIASPAMAADETDLAQLLEQESAPDTLERPHIVTPRQVPQADVTGVWYHIDRADAPWAQAELNRLRAENPRWQPPAEVMRAIRGAAARAALAAGAHPSPGDLAALRREFEPCQDPEMAWLLVERGLMPPGLLTDMAGMCRDPGVATGSLDRHMARLPEDARLDEIRRLLVGRAWPPAVRRILDDAVLGAELAALGAIPSDRAGTVPVARLNGAAEAVTARSHGDGAVMLGWLFLHRGDSAQALEWFERAGNWGSATGSATGEAQALFAKAAAAALANDMKGALDAARRSAAAGRSDALEALGWRLLDGARPADAMRAFADAPRTENAVFGHVLALRGAESAEEATTLACGEAAAMSARLRQTCGDLLTESLVAASKADNHAKALDIADHLAALDPKRPRGDIEPLIAWSRLRSGDATGAADQFELLLAASPDDGLAAGLAESLRTSGQSDRLANAATRFPQIGRILSLGIGDQAFARKQFDLADRLDAAPDILSGRAAWWVGAGIETRVTRGGKGQGRLSVLAPRLMAEGMVGDMRLGLQIVGARLNTGMAERGTELGSRFLAAETSTPLGSREVWYPVIGLRFEQPDMTLFGTLSTTPVNALVPARPVGVVGATIYRDPFSFTGRVFSRPVTSSLMSFAGMRDPVSGEASGRVVDSGLGLQGVWAPASPLSLAIGGEASSLDGRGTARTERFALRVDVGYNLAAPKSDFDYIRVGPFAAWTRYGQNLGHYTAGHGGYYSPETDLRGGLLLDVLTAEGQPWQTRLTSSASYGRAIEAASSRFPGVGIAGVTPYDPSSSSGISGDLTLQGMALLAPHLIIGGFAGASAAPGYDNAFAGMILTIPLQPRSAVFSSDLPVSAVHPVR